MSLLKEINSHDLLIVGSGLYGLTIAERVANASKKKVFILEKRNHIGGNAYSYFDKESGIEVHKYGSHLFHTSNKKIWDYVNTFTGFNNYQHKVFSIYKNKVYSMPVNLHTFSAVFNKSISPSEARDLILETADVGQINNLEDKAIALVGKQIYETLIKGYTQKQWQTDPKSLPPEIITRLPIRFTYNNNYFEDTWEGLPINGYGKWFEKMIESPRISIKLETDYFDIKSQVKIPTIFTGPVDRYFNYSDGVLGWRTLDFDFELLGIEDYQGTSVMNYADLNVPFTRIHEFKHLHPERPKSDVTVIAREFSRVANEFDEPYYPINSVGDRKILEKYRQKFDDEAKNMVFFGGRLGTYKYLDMHMAIGSALTFYQNHLHKLFS
jgi:UDP-galactopyranose mutase